jgi:hypothetical protein
MIQKVEKQNVELKTSKVTKGRITKGRKLQKAEKGRKIQCLCIQYMKNLRKIFSTENQKGSKKFPWALFFLIWSSALEEGKAHREKYSGLRPNHPELAKGINPGNLGGKCGTVT